MESLILYPSADTTHLAWPKETDDLNLKSAALLFFTDFKKSKPLVIESTALAIDVSKLMQKAHVRLKFVINDANQFIGIISTGDLTDQKLLIKVAEGLKREEILVADLMRSKTNLLSLDFNEISKSTIEEVDYDAKK